MDSCLTKVMKSGKHQNYVGKDEWVRKCMKGRRSKAGEAAGNLLQEPKT